MTRDTKIMQLETRNYAGHFRQIMRLLCGQKFGITRDKI